MYIEPAYTLGMSATKDHRLALRLSAEQDALIRRAADVDGSTLSEFGVAALVERAHDVLADQRMLVLDDAGWAEFLALLDDPPVFRPNLAALMARPPAWRT